MVLELLQALLPDPIPRRFELVWQAKKQELQQREQNESHARGKINPKGHHYIQTNLNNNIQIVSKTINDLIITFVYHFLLGHG